MFNGWDVLEGWENSERRRRETNQVTLSSIVHETN